ncbi:MAG: translocation/assembly module TamB [Lentisphaeria bacterium]|nr:translocation/assembly module TamB [Lentisphaeria bacterium]
MGTADNDGEKAFRPGRRLRRRVWRLVLAAFAVLSLALAALFACAWGLSRTQWGRDRLAAVGARWLSRASGWDVRLEGLRGGLPWSPSLDSLSLADGSGTWLEGEGLAVRLRPMPLVRGRIRIDALSCRRLVLHRLPRAGASSEPRSRGVRGLPDLAIGFLDVSELVVGPGVLDLPSRLCLEGRVERPSGTGRLTGLVHIRLLDLRGRGALTGAVAPEADSWRLEATADWSEEDPFLSRLAGLPHLVPLAMAAAASGRPEALAVEARVEHAGIRVARLDGTLRVADEELRLRVGGSLECPARVFPAAVGREVPAPLAWELEAALAERTVRVANAAVWTATDRLDGTGSFDTAAGTAECVLNLRLADLAAWPLPPALLVRGPLDLRLEGGRLQDGDVRLELTAASGELAWETWLARGLDLRAAWRLPRLNGLRWDRLPTSTFTLDGKVQGLDGPREAVPMLPQRLTWRLSGRTDADACRVESLQFALPWLGANGTLDWFPARKVASTSLRWQCEDVSAIPGVEPHGLGGAVAARTTARLSIASRRISLAGECDWFEPRFGALPARAWPDVHASFEGRWSPADAATIEKLEVRAGEVRLALSGEADPAARSARVDAEAACTDLRTLGVLWTGAPAGRIEARGGVRVAADTLTVDMDWQARDIAFGGRCLPQAAGVWRLECPEPFAGRHPRLSVRARGNVAGMSWFPAGESADYRFEASWATPDAIEVRRLEIAAAGATVTAAGGIAPRTGQIDAAGHLAMENLGSLGTMLGVRLAGALEVDVSARGPLATPRVEADMRADRLVLAGEDLHDLRIAARGTGGEFWRGTVDARATSRDVPLSLRTGWQWEAPRLRLHAIRLEGPELRLGGDLDCLLPSLLVTGSLRGTGNPEIFRPWIGREVAAETDIALRLDTADGRQNAGLELQLACVATPWFDAGAATLAMRSEDLRGTPRGSLQIAVTSVRRGGLAVREARVALNGTPRDLRFDLDAAGEWDAETLALTASGQVAWPESLTVHRFACSHPRTPVALLAPLRLSRRGEEHVLAPCTLSLGNGRLAAHGHLGPEGLQGEMLLTDVAAVDVAPAAWGFAGGTLSGRLALAGTLAAPRADLTLDLDDLRIREASGTALFTGAAAIEVGYAEERFAGHLAVRGSRGETVEGRLRLPGKLSLHPPRHLLMPDAAWSGELEADIDLGQVLRPLLPDGSVFQGRLRGRLSLGGTANQPALAGHVDVMDALYENYLTGTAIEGLQFRLQGHGEELQLTGLQATDGRSGLLDGSGRLRLGSGDRDAVDFALRLREFVVHEHPRLTVAADGWLRLSGRPSDLTLSGALDLTPGEVRIADWQNGIVNLDVVETRGGVQIAPPTPVSEPKSRTGALVPAGLNLDLTVQVPARVFVRGRGLDTEWRGEVRVAGPVEEASLAGNLTILRGTFTLGPRRLRIIEGTLAFDGARPIRPTLFVVAEERTGELLVRVVLSGPIDAPALRFESQPPMPTDEILARLLFRRGTGQISALQAVALASVVEEFTTGGGTFDINQRLRRLTGLDQIGIVAGDDGGAGTLEVGKYLTDRVYLQVNRGLGAAADSRVTVEVEITPRFSIETSADSAGGGLGFHWKHDY